MVFAILVSLATYFFLHSRKKPVSANNVNDDWEDSPLQADVQTHVAAH